MKTLLGLLAFLVIGTSASANLISYWNFNTYNGNGNPTTVSADSGAGTLSFSSGLSDSDVNNPATGTTLNALAAIPAGSSLSVIPGSPSNNGQYFQLSFSTLGLQDLVLTYATTGENGSFASSRWSYSTDGGSNFTDFGSPVNPSTSYSVITRDFTSVTAVNNLANVILRYTLGGAGAGAPNANKVMQIDNIQLNASVAAIPEPTSLTMVGLGAIGLAYGAYRRRRR